MIHFTCPTCKNVLKTPDEGVGQKVSCPSCGQRLQVPNPVKPAESNKTILGEPLPLAIQDATPKWIPPEKRRRPWMAFLVGLGACLAVLCAGLTTTGLVGWFALKSRVPNRTAPKRLYERADLIVSAQGLFTSYCESVPLADRTYNGKILEVSGTVGNSGRDNGREYVIFAVVRPSSGFERIEDTWARIAAASASGIQGVRCYFAAGKAPRLKAGESLTLRGRCSGMPLDVEIQECETLP